MAMGEIQQRTVAVLEQMAQILQSRKLPGEWAVCARRLALELEQLAVQVDQPCVVAVVGRVKAGKSTFLNALLGDDLAKVGTTETTATINYFRYGGVEDGLQVRCHWRDGEQTEVTADFADGLQGNDEETLRRADGIDHLEYFLPHPLLRRVTLVDTPGTGAVVAEHQNATAEFVRLHGQLRERHHQETERLGREADAVIYLVGQVARAGDQDFLEEFADATGQARAFNAVGVLAKIDLHPKVLSRREELAGKIADEFRDELNTVIPVSAGLRRGLDGFADGAFEHLVAQLRRVPADSLELLLDGHELFCDLDIEDSPLSAGERRELLGDLPWGVFRTIAEVAARPELSPQAVADELTAIAGFAPLDRVLERSFFRRGHILRCHRIVADARSLLARLRYRELSRALEEERDDRVRRDRYLGFLNRAVGDPGVARELEELVRAQLPCSQGRELEEIHAELDRALSALSHELEAFNADFEALQHLHEAAAEFSEQEVEELRALLGLYGTALESRLAGRLDADRVRERMQSWRQSEYTAARTSLRRLIAHQAYSRYGLILAELR